MSIFGKKKIDENINQDYLDCIEKIIERSEDTLYFNLIKYVTDSHLKSTIPDFRDRLEAGLTFFSIQTGKSVEELKEEILTGSSEYTTLIENQRASVLQQIKTDTEKIILERNEDYSVACSNLKETENKIQELLKQKANYQSEVYKLNEEISDIKTNRKDKEADLNKTMDYVLSRMKFTLKTIKQL